MPDDSARAIAAIRAGWRRRDLARAAEARALAEQGRGSDTEIAHVTPGEIVLHPTQLSPVTLAAVERDLSRRGIALGQVSVGSVDAKRNPRTGMMEFDRPTHMTGSGSGWARFAANRGRGSSSPGIMFDAYMDAGDAFANQVQNQYAGYLNQTAGGPDRSNPQAVNGQQVTLWDIVRQAIPKEDADAAKASLAGLTGGKLSADQIDNLYDTVTKNIGLGDLNTMRNADPANLTLKEMAIIKEQLGKIPGQLGAAANEAFQDALNRGVIRCPGCGS